MKNLLSILAVIAAIAWPALAAEESPITFPQISTNNSPEAVAAAKERGAASATKDIKARKFRILYLGKPWSVGKPLVDEPTGYRVQIVAGCVVTKEFVAEVEAYNRAMREWYSKSKAPSPEQKK